jgi:hypothetical protein
VSAARPASASSVQRASPPRRAPVRAAGRRMT